jgi:hypothetical protein
MVLHPFSRLLNTTVKAKTNTIRCYYLHKNNMIITPGWFYLLVVHTFKKTIIRQIEN